MTLQGKIDLAKNLAEVTKEDEFLCAMIHHYIGCLLQIKQTGEDSDLLKLYSCLKNSMDSAIKSYEQEDF